MDHDRFCAEWLASWTGGRAEALLAFYAPDAFYRDPARPGGLRGHEALRPYFERLLSLNPDWVWRAEEVLPTPTGCVLKWTASIPTPGGPVVEQGLDIVDIVDGRIVRNEVYFDRTAWLRALSSSR